MVKSKFFRALVITLIVIFTLQAGLMVYSMIETSGGTGSQQQTTTAKPGPITIETAADSVSISEEILNIIKSSDPANYERNAVNYREMLKKLDVHMKLKDEIERLLKAGYELPDVLTAYEFLYENYGRMEDIQKLADKKKAGEAWTNIFKDYNSVNPEFKPGSFESGYLDKLMDDPGVKPDDIMIADRIAQRLSKRAEDIMQLKLEGKEWKDISAGFGIVNSQSKLPYVPVTSEQMKKYTQQGSLTENQVIEALVTAHKLGKTGDEIIEKVKSGASREEIFAVCYEERYY